MSINNTTPSTITTSTVKLPSATPSFTDSHTWIAIITAVAAIVLNVFHTNVSAYVPAVSILAAAASSVALMVSKHKYASALVTASNGISQAVSATPVSNATSADVLTKITEANNLVAQLQSVFAPVATVPVATVATVPNTTPTTTPAPAPTTTTILS